MSEQTVIGIDIGGTKIRAGLLVENHPVHILEVPTPDAGGQAVIDAMIAVCQELHNRPEGPPRAIGIGSAGQIDAKTGLVIGSTDNIADWLGVDLKTPLESAFGVPVAVDNDVNVFALGEMTFGGGRGYDSALCLAIGTGVGGALVFGGNIWTGASYSAGEAGYLFAGMVDGEPSLLEFRAGGRAMELTYQKSAGLEQRLSLREVSRRALEEDDSLARSVIVEGAQLLGHVMGTTLTFFDPDVFIVGGGVPQIGPLWWDPFIRTIEAAPLRSSKSAAIRRAELGPDAVMLGAAALARKTIG
jgi:glucokinase